MFPKSAMITLIVGLVAVAVVVVFSVTPIFYPSAPLDDVDQAKVLAEQYALRQGSNLNVKEIMEFSNHYYAIIMEENTGRNAFEVLVDKNTGNVFLEPGPNMMWNDKYGHMRWSRNPALVMPVTSLEAVNIAQSWLDQNFPNAQAHEPEVFYGYYTIDFSRNSQIIGMLSVNGHSGEVWYHNWHGQFIRMVEYE